MLRTLLQDSCSLDPASVQLNGSGRPAVAGSPHLHLSLAHRHDWVAAALAGSPIGIDLELIRARNVDALAPLCCPQPEQEQLRALPAAQRLIRFHQLWVIKEAAFKAALTPHGALSFAHVAAHEVTTAACNARCWEWDDGRLLAIASHDSDALAALQVRDAPRCSAWHVASRS